MSRIKTLTRAEEDIMQYIWQLSRCTVSNVLELMPEPRPPHSSVSSIVRILERKGFVDHKAYGRTYEYFPIISKEDYGRRNVISLIKDYFNGSPSELVSFLVNKEETSVEELQQLIEELKKKKPMSILAYILQVTICLGVFYLFYYLALRRETFFRTNRMYLLVTLILSALLPLIRIYIQELQQAPELLQAPLYLGNYLDEFQQVVVVPDESATIVWWKVLLSIYLTGVLILVIRFIKSLLSIRKIKRTASLLSIENRICYISKDIQCPFSFFNAIFLPADHSFTEKELQEVIRHEHAHVASGHSWDILLLEAGTILFWPSPFIYFYKKSIREIHEYMADAAVLKDTPWESYAAMLVSQKQRGLQMQLSNQLIFSQLKKRLLMMNQKPSPNSSNWKYIGLIPLLIITALIFSFRQKDQVQGDQSTQPEIYVDSTGQTFVDGKEVTLAELTSTLSNLTGSPDPIRVYVDERNKVEMLSAFDAIAERFNFQVEFVKGKPNRTIANNPSEISLGGINIPPGSVRVAVGDHQLKENVDYRIDYKLGRIKILNDAILQSKEQIHVSYDGSSPNDTVEVYYAEEMPLMPGCANIADAQEKFDCTMKQMLDFIYQNLKYPEIDKVNKLEGQVMAMFVINKEGKMKDILVKRSKSETMTAEVIRVLELMAATVTWIPAKNDGKPVNLLYTLPVKFALGESDPTIVKKEDDDKNVLPPLNSLNSLNEHLPNLDPLTTDTSTSKQAKVSGPVQQPILTDCASLATINEQEKCSMDKIFKFLYENLKYPQEDRDNNVEGVAYVQVTIGIAGELSYEILRFPSETIKAELIRLFDLMKKSYKWIPAGRDSRQFVLPVKFILNDGLKKDPELSSPGLTAIIADPSKSPTQEFKSFSVKPNPANEEITIELYDGAQLVEVYDANGKGVLSLRVPGGSTYSYTIDVSKLASGLYTAMLIGKDEKRVAKFSIAR